MDFDQINSFFLINQNDVILIKKQIVNGLQLDQPGFFITPVYFLNPT